MKITSTILSIPPYLSTTWKNIASLHVRPQDNLFTLVVALHNTTQIEVPNLNKETIDVIFESHAKFTEVECTANKFPPLDSPYTIQLPMNSEGGLDTLPHFQHNPEQANLAPLMPEILKKIGQVAKAFGLEDLGEPEEDCNCMYCQLTRAMQSEDEEEIEISEDDLRFRDWEIVETGEKLYTVTNPIDANEHYQVFLGSPVGCTCGQTHCEHIRAVLNS